MAKVKACPICRLPVTFGGGKGITKGLPSLGFPSGPRTGLKKPCLSHQSYQADSTAMGLYPLAMGADKSLTRINIY